MTIRLAQPQTTTLAYMCQTNLNAKQAKQAKQGEAEQRSMLTT